jgi:hypothetical protein
MLGSVSLRLDVHAIGAQSILPDHTVEALITSSPQVLSCTRPPAVTHRGQQPENEPLEERGVTVSNALQHFSSHCCVGFLDSCR